MVTSYEINEYLYCPRLYYYIKKIGISPRNSHIAEGNRIHQKLHDRYLANLFLEDKELGLKGRVDCFTMKDKLTLLELKKGNGKFFYKNDRLQNFSYQYLCKKNGIKVEKGVVEFEDGNKHEVPYTKEDERELKKTIKEMNNLEKLPPRCENKNKCNGCNMKQYCWI